MTNTPLKNVVVLGLGSAGITAAKSLASTLPVGYRVVALSEHEFTFYHIGALRAAAKPNFENEIIGPLDNVFGPGSRHVVKAGVPVKKLDSKSIQLANGEVIEFAYAVIATGSTYAFPNRAPLGWSADKLKAELKAFRGRVTAASNILVIGAGATGIEFAGEVAAQFGASKQITLVHPSALIMSHGYKEKLGKNLENSLRALDVKIIGNTRIDTADLFSGPSEGQTFKLGDGSSITPDFIFIGFGSKPNSTLVKSFNTQLVNNEGFIKVKPTLQIADPTNGLNRVYVIGDVNDVKELKQAVTAKAQAPIAVGNIVSSIKDGNKPLKQYSPGKPLIVVTVGPKKGAGQLFGMVIGDFFTSKMKGGSLFVSTWKSDYSIKA